MLTATQSLAGSTWATAGPSCLTGLTGSVRGLLAVTSSTGSPLILKRKNYIKKIKIGPPLGFISGPPITTSQSPGTSTRPGSVDELITESRVERRGEERRGEERVCFYVCERDTERGESRTTHPEDSEAQDSQPILLTCHTAPALGKALPNCSAC